MEKSVPFCSGHTGFGGSDHKFLISYPGVWSHKLDVTKILAVSAPRFGLDEKLSHIFSAHEFLSAKEAGRQKSIVEICQLLLLLLLFLTFSVLVANPKKLLYTVANPARGLLNREKRTKEKVWQHTPPPHPLSIS